MRHIQEISVSELLSNHHLVIYCDSPFGCRYHSRFTRNEAIERFGADLRLSEIRQRGKCPWCSHKGAQTVCQYVGPTGRILS